MKTIILLLIIVSFTACTSSGKLTDAEFPYKFNYNEEHGTILPMSVGSYSITPILYMGESAELMAARMHLKVIIIIGIAYIILYIIAFISNKLNHEKDN